MLSPFLDFAILDGYNALYLACQYDSIGIALELMKSQIFQRKLEQVDRGKLQDIFPSSKKRSVFMFHLYWSQIRLILGLSATDGEYWLPKEVVGHLIYLFCASRVNSVKTIEQPKPAKKKGKTEKGDKVERFAGSDIIEIKKDSKGREKGKDKDKERNKEKQKNKSKEKPKAKYEQRLDPSRPPPQQEEAIKRRNKSDRDRKKLRNIFWTKKSGESHTSGT